jgi:ariadne-1
MSDASEDSFDCVVDDDSQLDDGWSDGEDESGSDAFGSDVTINREAEPYAVMDRKTIVEMVDEIVQDVAEISGLSWDASHCLLRFRTWDKEKLLHGMLEDNADEVLHSLGLNQNQNQNQQATLNNPESSSSLPASSPSFSSSSTSPPSSSSSTDCLVCMEEVSSDTGNPGFDLHCGHVCCDGCWREYVIEAVANGEQCVLLSCIQYKCPRLLLYSDVQRLLDSPPQDSDTKTLSSSSYSSLSSSSSTPSFSISASSSSPNGGEEEERESGGAALSVWDKYKRFLYKSFVKQNKFMKWCPAPGCDFVVKAAGSVMDVACRCGMEFCFQCYQESHSPATCKDLELWAQKCQDQSETAHWIIANTRRCPKCNVRIEKNQGCNHMTCTSCKHEFCWVCDGVWRDHGAASGGYYKCNKYSPVELAKKRKDAKDSKTSDDAGAKLNRYLHYYQRYHNHDNAKKFAARLRALTTQRMLQMQGKAQDSGWVDVQFLQEAIDQVFACRRVLKYTYVLSYFMADDAPERDLFEYLQQQLEMNTERLSELSEMKLRKINREEIVNYTRVTAQFLANLLEGVANGLKPRE